MLEMLSIKNPMQKHIIPSDMYGTGLLYIRAATQKSSPATQKRKPAISVTSASE